MGDNYMKKINAVLEFIIVGAVGTLWHFVYDWTGDNHFIGFFFPVNESTWEHLKLIFFPALIYSVIEYYVIKNKPRNYIPAAVTGIFGGMLSIVVFFYTYTGIIGYNIPFLNVLSFFTGVLAMLLIKRAIIKCGCLQSKAAIYISAIIAGVFIVLFVRWSYYPPHIGLFSEPTP